MSKIAIYNSKGCSNQIIRRVKENKVDVEILTKCAWCNKEHFFHLKEIFVDAEAERK